MLVLVENLRVYPVSAFQYRRMLSKDDEDPPFISDIAESGVPQMIDGLGDVGDQCRQQVEHDRFDACEAFRNRIVTSIELIEARWHEDTRAIEDAGKLRADIDEFIAPMRREFDSRTGAFREFLRTGVPDKIDALVTEAAGAAREDIEGYLRRLKDAHWATLKAAVKRDGAFHGSRYINLPDDFVQRFVEPIAEIWGARMLQDIRKRTKHFTDDCVTQVEDVV